LSEEADEKTTHGMCVIYLPADEVLRHPLPEPAEEPHQGGVS